ncbi:hypothetical protein LMG19282_02983 [Cupriavidus campinensis]|nr:hypothetical protein LMG19282_02983 [Cupriavidus campinensis]
MSLSLYCWLVAYVRMEVALLPISVESCSMTRMRMGDGLLAGESACASVR